MTSVRISQASSNQPAYLLATPTVAKLSPGSSYDIIIGSANGKLYALSGHDLTNRRGFPITVDSITSQVGELYRDLDRVLAKTASCAVLGFVH